MSSLQDNLFDAHAAETHGERAQGALFELLAVALCSGYAWSWIPQMVQQQRVLKPQGLAHYLDVSWLFDVRLAVANATLISVLCCVGFARAQRTLYLGAALLLHLQYVARFAMGKNGHGSHLVGTALLALGLAGLVVRPERARRAAIGLTVFLAGVGYTSAAACKLIATGPRWVDGRNLWLWISEKQLDLTSQFGSAQLNFVQTWLMHSRALSTALLCVGMLTELTAWLMWWRRPRPYVMLGLIGMHLGIEFTLDVAFIANATLLTTLALPIARWTDRQQCQSVASANEPSLEAEQVRLR